MTTYDVVIVGGGHAGAQAAMALRQVGYEGTIGIIGDEPDLPYERPPLSKDYLAREKTFERILIRPASFWADRRVDMLLHRRVIALDPSVRTVSLQDGGTIGYCKLIWAAGGSPRRLTCCGHDLAGVHSIRTRADVDSLMAQLATVKRIVVVGGGYIGLEAAAVLTKSGRHITVLEAMPRVLARVAGEPLSRFYEAEHRAHGVDVRLNTTVSCIEETSMSVAGVRLSTGEVVAAEMVIVGIGIVPAVEPLLAAGAIGSNGVDVDEHCYTSLPDVFAIGDCAAHFNAFANGVRLRVESIQNANDQATVAARAILGMPMAYHSVPWFWSNQYDLRLQTVGLSIGYDQTVVRGTPEVRSFSVIYLRQGRVIALDCVNATKDYVQGRKLIESRACIDPILLADQDVSLKELSSTS